MDSGNQPSYHDPRIHRLGFLTQELEGLMDWIEQTEETVGRLMGIAAALRREIESLEEHQLASLYGRLAAGRFVLRQMLSEFGIQVPDSTP